MMSERPGNRIERAYRHLLAETKKLLPSQDWCCTSVYIESRGRQRKMGGVAGENGSMTAAVSFVSWPRK